MVETSEKCLAMQTISAAFRTRALRKYEIFNRSSCKVAYVDSIFKLTARSWYSFDVKTYLTYRQWNEMQTGVGNEAKVKFNWFVNKKHSNRLADDFQMYARAYVNS